MILTCAIIVVNNNAQRIVRTNVNSNGFVYIDQGRLLDAEKLDREWLKKANDIYSDYA